ncbi:MAG: DNA internalization-related competence protein ComEC/Rec2 [Comamonadaceae bacterium]|nr:MAG: DNA internalization-related competence protein ComEC/Rec2 [Comamonadaceae bacterium]
MQSSASSTAGQGGGAHFASARPWRVPALAIGGLLGAALQLQQAALWPASAYACIAAVALACAVLALWPRPAGRRVPEQAWKALACIAGAALSFAWCGLRAAAFGAQALVPALEGQDVRITAVVAAMPQLREAGVRLRLATESARLDGVPVTVPGLIDVAWYAAPFSRDAKGLAQLQRPPPVVRAGERWEMTVRLRAPHGSRNPHGFDYELYLWEQGVQASGSVRTGVRDEPPVRLASTWRYPVEQVRQHVRDAILQRLTATLAPGDTARQRAAGVVAALVTGDQRAIDRADWDVFRVTGVAHLMSISGLHITLFAWLASMAVLAVWRRSQRLSLAVAAPTAALVGGVALAWAYALFSGWGVPAQRTICMLATVALLRLSGRRWPWPQVWLLACAVVLAVDPWAMLQAGFWLSFVAVAALYASDPGSGQQQGSRSLRDRAAGMLREQWVVTLALTPLTLLWFGQVSVVGLLANLLAIPWTTLVVTPLALGGMLLPPLWTAAAWSVQPLSAVLQWLASWPWAQVAMPMAPLWLGAAAMAGGMLLVLRMPWQVRLLGLPLLLPVLAWAPPRPGPGHFELMAVDIGQGQAVIVRTARHALLYDAGPRYFQDGDAGQRVLVPLLYATGERLDMVVLSHRDSDHTGGAAAVLEQQPQATVLGSIEDSHPLQALRPVRPCLAGQRWQWDGVEFEMLHPSPTDLGARAAKPNAMSCVLRINAAGGGASALLAGDIERAQEAALLARGAALAADVLLVPHHGSKTSSTAAFLDAVAPRTALVQAGYRNRFGHPAPEVVRRYVERGIRLVQTDRCGAATWTSHQPGGLRCEREAGRRYWHHVLPGPSPEKPNASPLQAPMGQARRPTP